RAQGKQSAWATHVTGPHQLPTCPHSPGATMWFDRLTRRVALDDHDTPPPRVRMAEHADAATAPSPDRLEPSFSRRQALTLAFATALGASQLRWLLTPSYAKTADCYGDYHDCVNDVNAKVIGATGKCAFPAGVGLILAANP